MIKKEKFSLLIAGLFSVFCIRLVSAVSPNAAVEQAIEWVTSAWAPFFSIILGTDSFDEFLFAKILVLILIFAVVYMALAKTGTPFSGNRPVLFTISIIVAILSVRYMGENDFIMGVLLPYGVLGAAITIFLPLMIYFLFVESMGSGKFLRRAAWVGYGIVFLIMWMMRIDEISSAVSWIYTSGLIFVIICFVFDGPIHGYFDSTPLRRLTRRNSEVRRREILREIHQLGEDYNNRIVDQAKYDTEIKMLKSRYKKIK